MRINREQLRRKVRSTVLSVALLAIGTAGLSQRAAAQTYSCFPNCNQTDGRMLVLAGVGSNTLAGDTIVMKITSPATANSVIIGMFDGESGGLFDHEGVNAAGTARNATGVPSEYTLFADPSGEGKTFTMPVATWSGATMANNAWSDFAVVNDPRAKAPSGAYIYALRIRNTDPTVNKSYNGFKLRTDGAIALKGYQSFAVFVPLNTPEEAVIYPNGLGDMTTTTYDGTWQFFLDVPFAMNNFAVWDGDMDYGSADASYLDSDDPDSPASKPLWAAGTAAVNEGVAIGSQMTDGTGRYRTGLPADDNQFLSFARPPSVWYEVVHPDGTRYENRNPSGNLEWEQFSISTAPFNRSQMDYHADSLPAGVYQVKMYGMDLHNLNAWRFFNDALGQNSNVEVVGVSASGEAVIPAKPYNVTGTIFYDDNGNGVQDNGENGIPSVDVFLLCDYNLDGTIDETKTETTDEDGLYIFENVGPGNHRVQTDLSSLSDDVRPTGDADGTGTPNATNVTATGGTAPPVASFAYQRVPTVGVGTRAYWLNHPNQWPLTGMYLGSRYYTRNQCIDILKRPTRGDNTYLMAAQLIAAKLNVARGADASCISETITDGDEWLTHFPVGSNPRGADWLVETTTGTGSGTSTSGSTCGSRDDDDDDNGDGRDGSNYTARRCGSRYHGTRGHDCHGSTGLRCGSSSHGMRGHHCSGVTNNSTSCTSSSHGDCGHTCTRSTSSTSTSTTTSNTGRTCGSVYHGSTGHVCGRVSTTTGTTASSSCGSAFHGMSFHRCSKLTACTPSSTTRTSSSCTSGTNTSSSTTLDNAAGQLLYKKLDDYNNGRLCAPQIS